MWRSGGSRDSYDEAMSEEQAIQVNFGKAIPLFPLESAVLLPQQVLPLHIFEPRYRQMIETALDGSGQIAMAVFRSKEWKLQYHARPPLRPAVCVGQIMQHEKLADGRYNILLQGVCRARIVREMAPQEGLLFRQAMLEPVGIDPEADEQLFGVRERLADMLEEGRLTQLKNGPWVLERFRDEEIPTTVLLELAAFALPIRRETKYTLLAEGDAAERAHIVEVEMRELARLMELATQQHPEDWPKGCSWN